MSTRAPGPFTGYGRARRSQPPRLGSVPGSTVEIREVGPPRKTDCPGHIAGRDSVGRYPVGDCGPDCLIRAYRLGRARLEGGRWVA